MARWDDDEAERVTESGRRPDQTRMATGCTRRPIASAMSDTWLTSSSN
jgi:hypothetical protein